MMPQSFVVDDVTLCPHNIITPSHFRPDGTCKCLKPRDPWRKGHYIRAKDSSMSLGVTVGVIQTVFGDTVIVSEMIKEKLVMLQRSSLAVTHQKISKATAEHLVAGLRAKPQLPLALSAADTPVGQCVEQINRAITLFTALTPEERADVLASVRLDVTGL